MSQHIIEEENIRWVFGWDRPLQTFFLQVHDLSLDEGSNPVVWLGATAYTVIPSVDELVRLAKGHGLEIKPSMQIILHNEHDAEM